MQYRHLTDVEDAICHTQADIYLQVVEDGYDIESFSDAYLTSHFCECSMDTLYSRFQIEFSNECLDFIYSEIKDSLRPSQTRFNMDCVEWAGYMYRALSIITGMKSNELQQCVPFVRLASTYAGLHIEDDTLIFEDLCEIFKLPNK